MNRFLHIPRDYHLTIPEQIDAVSKEHPRAQYVCTANRLMYFLLIGEPGEDIPENGTAAK